MKICRLSAIALLLFGSSTALAGGFQLWEESAVGTGDYHAGAAAEGDDVSLEFYNPAQVTSLKHTQVSAGGVIIPMTVDFDGRVVGARAFGKSKEINPVPNFHLGVPISKRLFFTFGVTAPFGLQTDYDDRSDFTVQFAADETKLMTININPGIAYRLTSWLSAGVGYDAMYGEADYNSRIDATDLFTNHLSAWGHGYNAGLFFNFHLFHAEPTHIGVSYRSGINLNASGPSKLLTNSTTAKAEFKIPATTMISLYQPVTPRFSVMASAFYTQWRVFSELLLENTAFTSTGFNIPVHENYRNTWNFALGAHGKLTRTLMWKVGGGYDQTPTRTGYRDIRLPDANRIALSTGLRWMATQKFAVEGGFTHLFTPKSVVDNTDSAASSLVIPRQSGRADVNVNVIGLQLTWTMS